MSKFKKKATDSVRSYEPKEKPFELTGNPDTIVVIDGDEIAFKIAAACEKRGIKVTNKSNKAEALFNTRTELKKLLSGLEVPEDFFSIEDTQIAEPIQNAISTLKKRVKAIADKCDAGVVEIYISGEGNFRDDLPLPVKYKGEREGQILPLLLRELRSYLIDYKGAIPIDGMETDDQVSIRMTDGFKSGEKIIGASQDKDNLMTSGWILSPDKMDKPLYINGFGKLYVDDKNKVRGIGRKFLYFQVLTGDSTDCYNPRDVVAQVEGKKPRFGDKAAYNLLKAADTDKECWKAIVGQYKEWFGEGDYTYKDFNGSVINTNYLGILQTYFLAAYMRRTKDDIPNIPRVLEKLGVLEPTKL